jgi:hypothetical protein
MFGGNGIDLEHFKVDTMCPNLKLSKNEFDLRQMQTNASNSQCELQELSQFRQQTK